MTPTSDNRPGSAQNPFDADEFQTPQVHRRKRATSSLAASPASDSDNDMEISSPHPLDSPDRRAHFARVARARRLTRDSDGDQPEHNETESSQGPVSTHPRSLSTADRLLLERQARRIVNIRADLEREAVLQQRAEREGLRQEMIADVRRDLAAHDLAAHDPPAHDLPARDPQTQFWRQLDLRQFYGTTPPPAPPPAPLDMPPAPFDMSPAPAVAPPARLAVPAVLRPRYGDPWAEELIYLDEAHPPPNGPEERLALHCCIICSNLFSHPVVVVRMEPQRCYDFEELLEATYRTLYPEWQDHSRVNISWDGLYLDPPESDESDESEEGHHSLHRSLLLDIVGKGHHSLHWDDKRCITNMTPKVSLRGATEFLGIFGGFIQNGTPFLSSHYSSLSRLALVKWCDPGVTFITPLLVYDDDAPQNREAIRAKARERMARYLNALRVSRMLTSHSRLRSESSSHSSAESAPVQEEERQRSRERSKQYRERHAAEIAERKRIARDREFMQRNGMNAWLERETARQKRCQQIAQDEALRAWDERYRTEAGARKQDRRGRQEAAQSLTSLSRSTSA
ncbi:hypothetical protein C8F01DRAFT_1084002 [Mycena amicta]|nr:hypothetical protein C8F01DRAFT_1084002 [Mycena amicta]